MEERGFKPYCYIKASSGVIYQRIEKKIILKKEESNLKIHKSKKVSLNLFRSLAYICFTFAVIGLLILASPILIAESQIFASKVNNKIQKIFVKKIEEDIFPKASITPEPTIAPTPTPDPATLPFYIKIVKIGVDAKVIPNVDTVNPEVYKAALKEGVAHALGSAFPGQEDMIYIFGHSTDYAWNVATYNALFYQIKDLEEGDEIVLLHGGVEYRYAVSKKAIVEASDTALINENQYRNVLILQTCYPPGTSWKRLILLAKPIGSL
jgi:LPXTG-site transpeptidase (sortase) family protein